MLKAYIPDDLRSAIDEHGSLKAIEWDSHWTPGTVARYPCSVAALLNYLLGHPEESEGEIIDRICRTAGATIVHTGKYISPEQEEDLRRERNKALDIAKALVHQTTEEILAKLDAQKKA